MDLAVRSVEVAEDDGVRRAGLLASRLQIAIFDGGVGALGINTMLADALHAVGAFFHDAAAADRYIGIAHELELRCLPVLEKQEVKSPHFVRAVVGTITRADTAVVDHVIK